MTRELYILKLIPGNKAMKCQNHLGYLWNALEQRIARYTRGEAVVKARIFHAKAEKVKREDFYVPLLILLTLLSGCAAPKHDHPLYIPHVTNFVRAIEPTENFAVLKGWVNVMQRQSIKYKPDAPTYATLKRINDECNTKPYKITPAWPTPNEFAAAASGDCKGYAICKYYKLRAAGFSANQLNLWSGDYDGNAHLVLVVALHGSQYVLDAINPNLPQAQDYFYQHFQPSYRFNEFGWEVN